MGPVWEPRAPEIQRMLDEGWSIGAIAKHFGAKRHVMRSKMSQLRKKGLLQYGDRATHHDDYQREISEAKAESGFKESVEILQDGTHKSDKLLRMSAEQSKDVDYLLKAHGYDRKAWSLVSARSNIWNAYSKQDGIMTLYASKITVKPRLNGFNYDDLLSVIRADVKPVEIAYNIEMLHSERMLEIGLMDCHFGNASYQDYKETQRTIYELIRSKHWEQVLFCVGSDMFHVDNFKSTTVNGTQLETTDLPKAWSDCVMFYDVLIQTAFQHCNLVNIVYVPGNHDSSVSWSFVQYLKARFPQADFDDRVKERKVFVYRRNFIGLSHGEKSRKDLIRIFPAEFPIEWSQTSCREAHIGHLHREEETRAKDEFGLTVRTLATKNPIDQYHDSFGFTHAHKRFMLFEYDENALKHIHYV